MPYSNSLWSQIMKMSQQMLMHAQQGHWPEISRIEAQRQVLIKECFDAPIPLSATATVRNNIKLLMQVDRNVMNLCEEKRNLIAADLNSHRHSRNACQSYQQCG